MQRRSILAALGALAVLPLALTARRVAAALPKNMADVRALEAGVITSYSIHYTKLYDNRRAIAAQAIASPP